LGKPPTFPHHKLKTKSYTTIIEESKINEQPEIIEKVQSAG